MGPLIRLGIIIIIWIPLTALNAWALQTLWNWYIPHIFGLLPLGFSEAVGVALLVTYLTHTMSHNIIEGERENWQDLIGRISVSIIKPLFGVGAGWVYLWVWPIS